MANKAGIGTLVTEEHELVTDSLDLFSIPSIETAQIAGSPHIYLPVGGTITNEGPYEIIVPNDGNDYLKVDSTYLYGEFQVVKADGTGFVAADKVSIVNNSPQSLFKQIDVYLNGTCVNDQATSTYHFKAFIENHFSYPTEIKATSLAARELYSADEPDKEIDWTDAAKHGFAQRRKVIREASTLCFMIKIHNDFLMQTKYLLPGVELKLRLVRNDDSHTIIADAAAAASKIVMKKLELHTRKITIEPSISSKIENALSSKSAMYVIAHSKIRAHLLAAATKNITVPQVVRGRLPRTFILFFVPNEAYSGNKTKNMYVFKNHTLEYFQVNVDGRPLIPNGWKIDWDGNKCIKQYVHMLDNIGLGTNFTNGINIEDFKTNSCIFPFDMTPDLCNSYNRHGFESGHIDVDLGFKTALTEGIQLCVFAVYDEIITIDKNREVALIPS